jgi:hypothetical protein
MLHIYDPTILAPSVNSPQWYKAFHNSFYLSQITNQVLLSAFEASAESLSTRTGILGSDAKRIKAGATEAVALAISSLKETPGRLKEIAYAMMVDAGDTFEKSIELDSAELLKSVDVENWFETIKGFLNLWEFLFLYGIAESTLREVAQVREGSANGLINCLLKKYPELEKRLIQEHCLDRSFCHRLWDMLTTIRNVYAHSHGMISNGDIDLIRRNAKLFNKSYKHFIERLSEQSVLAGHISKVDHLYFSDTHPSAGRFYILRDVELNIFRNFICKFMAELQDEFALAE